MRPAVMTPGELQRAAAMLRAGRSPVSDLIDKHRAEMRRIWERHVEELRNLTRAA